jgi:DnaJ-class molecular chaperone
MRVPLGKRCPTCVGSGTKGGHTCPACGGSGSERVAEERAASAAPGNLQLLKSR